MTSKSRMKNEYGLWIFQLLWHRSLSLQQRYSYPPYGTRRSMVICGKGWSAAVSRCGDCPGTSLYPKPLTTSDCAFPREQSFQLCWPLFILPGGSCLDIVFHSLLIEFCFFFLNLILRCWIDWLPGVHSPRYLQFPDKTPLYNFSKRDFSKYVHLGDKTLPIISAFQTKFACILYKFV